MRVPLVSDVVHPYLLPPQDDPGSFEVLESFVLSKLRQAAELQKRTRQERDDDKEGASAAPSTFSCFPSAAGVAVPPMEPPSSKQVPGVDAIDCVSQTASVPFCS